MSQAKKLPSGRWRNQLFVGYDDNGKRIYESFTADTKAEANLLAARRKAELEEGVRKARTPSRMTLGEAIDRYIENRDAILSPKTIREYKSYRRLYMQPLMRVKLSELTDEMIQGEINKAARELSPKSIRNIWGFFRAVITATVPDRTVFSVKLPPRERKEMHIPSSEELMKLFDAVRGKRLEVPVLLAATCGLRRGEIAALDLEKDVDYERNTISITKAVSHNDLNEWIVKAPKAYDSYRVIDAPPWVVEILRDARDDGYEAMNPDHISTAFAKLCKRLEINVRFHDLRHYYASLMLSLGVPDKYAMKRMGHSTNHMLKNIYQHLIDEKNVEITEQINAYFDSMQHGMQHGKPKK